MMIDLTQILYSTHLAGIGIFIGLELHAFLRFCRNEYVDPWGQILPISLLSIVNASLLYLKVSVEPNHLLSDKLLTIVKVYVTLAILTLIAFYIVKSHNKKVERAIARAKERRAKNELTHYFNRETKKVEPIEDE
jgi:cobalamin biosynthesis protein CobD/CbiB